jgi:hypothetical protein
MIMSALATAQFPLPVENDSCPSHN